MPTAGCLSGRVLADVGAIALLVDVALIRLFGLLACSRIAGFHVPPGEFAVRLGLFRTVAVFHDVHWDLRSA